MSDLRELYQEMILDHGSKPRNYHKIEGANRQAEGYNPLCGDRITLFIKMNDDTITDVGFIGTGCIISRASASMMTQSIKGRSRKETEQLFSAFHKMVTREAGSDFNPDSVGDLEALSGVAEFPARIKCATLSWHTLRAALKGEEIRASTE